MERIAFKMKLKKGFQEEYKKRHDEIWPEVAEHIRKNGIYDFSIYLDQETDELFAVQKRSGDKSSQDLGNAEITQKWWDYMSDIMETNEDGSPVSVPLREVFHLD